MTQQRYCVVGGGISGLVAAYRLRVLVGDDADITVFDPADRLGGILRTERLAGQPMDVGAEAFVVRRPEVPALLAELGLAGRQISTTGVRPTIYSQARIHPLPPDTVNGIPTSAASVTGLVDDATIAQMAAEPNRPLDWRAGADPAVGAVVTDRFGEQVVARSVDPMLSGVYAGSAATIGIRSAAPTLAAALDAGATSLTEAGRRALPGSTRGPVFGAIEGGYQVLLDELIARSRLRWVQARVDRIEPEGDGWSVRDDEGSHWGADAVIVAVPAPRLAPLLAEVAPSAAAAAARIPVASAAVLALAVPGGTPLPAQSGVLVATGERLRTKAITLSTRKWGARGNAELLRLSFGRFGDSIARNTSDADLQAWALTDLQTVFGIAVDPLDVLVHRWLDAMPQYGPGHRELTAGLHTGLPPTLAIAGNYLDGIGVPACVAVAARAAQCVVAATTRG
ncbi:protoporphyrinogen oxidase [Mycobacterium sp. CVI_P3]|uniref:Coproporphyrinogen III oxidase n=1 Tax=Mycobacterium pinniadriaticum TaxID=2994102 RepID=A0ABT3SIA5_9MYCO|nr:protoporphyrinogen oxidase [Mycobacterium pinniadriaticum]MCX2932833.1 protoporphyrinogen oxidase [Mycobacterium pinniadriaticum]MCX2939257.1 protoporphyrinogen oxidase [Mycobacterium pinniadriaticum]